MPAARPRGLPGTTEAAFRALIRAYGLIKHLQEPYFARFGVSGSQWGVLRTLHRAEQEGLPGLRLTDLSERLLIRPPSVTGVVDRLQRLGLAARSASETDLRAKCVRLTPAGRALVERVLKGHEARIQAILGGLSLKEQERLRRLLGRLGSHLEAFDERPDGPLAIRVGGARSSPDG